MLQLGQSEEYIIYYFQLGKNLWSNYYASQQKVE